VGVDDAYLFKSREICKLTPYAAGTNDTYVDGACFRMRMRPWSFKGVKVGTVVHTEALRDFVGDLEWSVAGIRTDRDEPFETCAVHSPGQVYYPFPDPIAPGSRSAACAAGTASRRSSSSPHRKATRGAPGAGR
jgi:hypothetical protein